MFDRRLVRRSSSWWARSFMMLVSICAICSCGRSNGPERGEGPPASPSYKDLAAAITRLPIGGDIKTLRSHLPAGIELVATGNGFLLKLHTPVAAASLIRAWGLNRVYAVSGDVHQKRWHLVLYTADVKDPYNKRIATKRPQFGAWTVIVELAKRPKGALPKLFAGASPAYEMGPYKSKVIGITLRK